jgi:hypothetical protein
MATKPTDRFDRVPDDLLRTGAHRAAPKPGRGWIAFAWAALATGVLVAAGLFGLAVIRGTVELPFLSPSTSASKSGTATPSATPTPTPTPTPAVDPKLAITVLNGTKTKGLAAAAGDNLVKQGWAGASEAVGSRTNAATSDVKTTVVYYSDKANENAARAMVLSLKVGTIQLSAAYPGSPITVVLGADYKLPVG